MTDMRRTVALLVSATATLLGGCASTMSGLGGEGSYACKAPVGSQCTSVSGVYANSIHGQPPASALPKPAKANKPIFFEDGKAKAVADVHKKFEDMMGMRLDRYNQVRDIAGAMAYSGD